MKLNDGRVVPAFLDQALRGNPITIFGDGSQTRSFCYVSDLVEGLYRLLLSDEALPVNLGNPREMTIGEFANMIAEADGKYSGRDLPCRCRKTIRSSARPDITKARRLLGWEPVVPLEVGHASYRGVFPAVCAEMASL